MGLIENGAARLESNMVEQLTTPRDLDGDRECDPLTPYNHKMGQESFVTETAKQKETNEDAKKREPALENVKIQLDSTYLEVASENGKLVPLKVETTDDSMPLENEDRESSGLRRQRRAKLISPTSSLSVLHPKSSEVEPIETVREGCANEEKKRRGRKRKTLQKSTANEFSRTKTHLRYLLHRIKYEQNLIDAYSAEGWRGQSLEKLKPEKELEKAKSHILRYKLRIRAFFQQLDQSLASGKLPESLFDSQGEIDSEDIFCAKCGSKDLTLDNDIILCDGACERGFHQFCLEPPLLKNDIPPGDESWLCPGCECKADCIDMLKDFHGTRVSVIDSWEKIFPEAASGKETDDGCGSSSDDSEDEEYDPDKPESPTKVEEEKSSSDESISNDVAASHNNEQYLGLPSDDSEDDDFDPSVADQENPVKPDSSSSDFSSDSEDLEALIDDETEPREDLQNKQEPVGFNEEISKAGRKKRQPLKDELSYLMEASAEPLSGKRRVERLDYQKLNKETYGDSSSDSSDEDFDCDEDTVTPKRRKTRKTTEDNSSNKTLDAQSNTCKVDENQIEEKHLTKRTRRSITDGQTNESSVKAGSGSGGGRKSTHKRLSEATTQRLYESFNVNQYPNKNTKEDLAKELGLEIRQVSKWFENARWSFNHRPRVESATAARPPEPQPTIGGDGSVS